MRESRAQRLAVDELHHDERGAGVVAEFEDGENVWMRQLRDAHGLALEPRHRRVIFGQRVGEDFDRDVAIRRSSLGAVQAPMPPAPMGAMTS